MDVKLLIGIVFVDATKDVLCSVDTFIRLFLIIVIIQLSLLKNLTQMMPSTVKMASTICERYK